MAGYRLILSNGEEAVELYELASDPLETNVLPHADSTQAQVLTDRLADWAKFIAANRTCDWENCWSNFPKRIWRAIRTVIRALRFVR